MPSFDPRPAPDPDAPAPGSGRSAGGESSTRRPASAQVRASDASSTAPSQRAKRQRRASLTPGEILGGFDILRPLGIGGMGEVYLARDARLDRLVAVKLLAPDQARDPETVGRFQKEGRAAARLDHENIARVYALGEDRGLPYIVFEYVEGVTLRQLVDQEGPLPPGEAVDAARQVAEALIHSESRGVIHRDIKPSNLLRTPDGRIKLVDLGLARHLQPDGDEGLTQSGVTLGTFDYISPEQARDPRDVDIRSDLYSLGCTLFHLLIGRPPFARGTALQKLLQHQEEAAPDLRTLVPDAPPALAATVRKLLEKDRSRRYQTPGELRDDLRTLAAALDELSQPQATPGWERHLVWGVPAIGLVMIVSLLFWWNQPGELAAALADRNADVPVSVPRPAPSRATDLQPSNPTTTPASVAAERPLVIPIAADADLSTALRTAPNGATLVLTHDGPYEIIPTELASISSDLPVDGGRQLTIRAARLARPVLRARRAPAPAGESTLLAFRGGRVRLEGLEFQLDGAARRTPLAAVHARGVDLSLDRCTFRRAPGTRVGSALRAIDVREAHTSSVDTEPPAPLRLTSCFVDRGLIGILCRGSLDLQIRDAAFGPGEPAVWIDNSSVRRTLTADVGLRRVSILAGPGPVLRFAGTAARVVLEQSVVAAGGDGSAVLVATDAPEDLDWTGRDNLYGRMTPLLQPFGTASARGAIFSFSEWADDQNAIREFRSRATEDRVWAHADPSSLLDRHDPMTAFRLATGIAVGTRRGPRGPLLHLSNPLAGLLQWANPRTPIRSPDTLPSRPTPPIQIATADPERVRPTDRTSGLPAGMPPAESEPRASEPIPSLSNPGGELGINPQPMPTAPPSEVLDPSTSFPRQPADNASTRPATPPSDASSRPPGNNGSVRVSTSKGSNADNSGSLPQASSGTDRISGRLEPESTKSEPPRIPDLASPVSTPVATAEALRLAIQNRDNLSQPIHLTPDEPLVLAPMALPAGCRKILQGEPDAPRPRLVIRPGRDGAFSLTGNATLELRDVDIELAPDAGAPFARTVFSLEAGCDLVLSRVTVTASGVPGPIGVAVVRIRAAGPGSVPDGPASVRVEDCFLRTGGDVVQVAGVASDATFANSLVGCGGTIVRGIGLGTTSPDSPIRLALRQSSVRASGGLVRLDAAPDAEPPRVEVLARDAILTTGDPATPLLRVTGPDPVTLRDRISWEGHQVAYHRIATYRLEEATSGDLAPLALDRASWEEAVTGREDSPFHGDVRFASADAIARLPADRLDVDDFRLADDSPVAADGPRLTPIPSPPDVRFADPSGFLEEKPNGMDMIP